MTEMVVVQVESQQHVQDADDESHETLCGLPSPVGRGALKYAARMLRLDRSACETCVGRWVVRLPRIASGVWG